MEYALGDLVKMRKPHPCGSDRFVVVRVGVDVKIKCEKCGRIIMLDRPTFQRRLKSVIEKADNNHDG